LCDVIPEGVFIEVLAGLDFYVFGDGSFALEEAVFVFELSSLGEGEDDAVFGGVDDGDDVVYSVGGDAVVDGLCGFGCGLVHKCSKRVDDVAVLGEDLGLYEFIYIPEGR